VTGARQDREAPGPVDVRRLGLDEVGLVALIDRSEHVEVEYCVVDGALRQRPVTMADIPPWDTDGDGAFSVSHYLQECTELLGGGAVLLGAFDDGELLGVAVVDPVFEPPLAWLAFLQVSAPARRRGVASALWVAAAGLARASGSERLYVSATPTGSAVGFYLRQGCRLADPVHPALWAKEPDDVHLVLPLARPAGGPIGPPGRAAHE
jgi:GNAT superfamily N-acetyltransferase